MRLTITLIILGKVQGVYYRQSSRAIARQLGVTGFVMNQPDQSVLIVATGNREQLDELISWCRQGPPAARVDTVQVLESSLQEFSDFSIRR